MSKKKITIEVEPETAVIAIGLMKGYMPSIIQQMRQKINEFPQPMKMAVDFEENIMEVIEEIYEKCIAETSIREGAANILEILRLTGRYPDKTEN